MTVMIFELSHSGHRYTYVRLLVTALLELRAGTGQDIRIVVVLTGDGCRSEQFKAQLAPLMESAGPAVTIKVCDLDGVKRKEWAAAGHLADLLLNVCEEVRPDHVIVPFGDGLVQVMGWRSLTLQGRRFAAARRGIEAGGQRRKMTIETLLLSARPAYARGLKERLLSLFWLTTAGASPFDRVHYLDEGLAPSVAANPKFALMPDPVRALVMERCAAREKLGIETSGRIAGCVGGIDLRKGGDVLVRAFAAARRGGMLRPDDRLLLAGPMWPEVRAVVDEVGRDGMVVMDRYVSDEELDAAVSAMDLVCTLYPKHRGSASIVIRAAGAGRMVMGSDTAWIGRTVREHGLGRTTPLGDVSVVARTLAECLDEAETFTPGAKARAWVERHTPEHFAACWTAMLRSRLGERAVAARPERNLTEAALGR